MTVWTGTLNFADMESCNVRVWKWPALCFWGFDGGQHYLSEVWKVSSNLILCSAQKPWVKLELNVSLSLNLSSNLDWSSRLTFKTSLILRIRSSLFVLCNIKPFRIHVSAAFQNLKKSSGQFPPFGKSVGNFPSLEFSANFQPLVSDNNSRFTVWTKWAYSHQIHLGVDLIAS